MNSSDSIIKNNYIETELLVEAVRYSDAIQSIINMPTKGKIMYIYKPEIIYHPYAVTESEHISNPHEALALFRKLLLGPIEKVGCLFLNCKNEVMEKHVITDIFSGTVDQSPLFPREILKLALLNNSSRIIIAHNHPSSITTPSNSDINITHVLKEGARLIGVELLDHIIISENNHYSFLEQGVI